MIQNLNLYSIALLDLSLLIHPNWLLYAPSSFSADGTFIGVNDKFVLVNTTNVK